MLLLVFLLLPMALQAQWDLSHEWDFGTYVVTTYNNGALKSINPKCPISSAYCYNVLGLKSNSVEYSNVLNQFYQKSNLSLTNISLTNLSESVLSNFKNLTYLNVANNNIWSLKNRPFTGLKNLDYLDVSNNQLTLLRKGDLSGIPQKTNINVKGNPLSFISTLVFQNSNERHEDTANNNNRLMIKRSVSGNPSKKKIKQDPNVRMCFLRSELVEVTMNWFTKNANVSYNCMGKNIHTGILSLKRLKISKLRNNWYGINENVLVTEIDISFNSIRRISRAMLNDLPETVTTLKFSFNNLKSIEEDSFSKLKRLLNLFLDNNKLRVLRYTDLQSLSSLEHLVLYGNHLKYIKPDAFLDLQNLIKLDLSNNKLHHIYKGTFERLNNIQFLYLNKNRLRNITDDTFFNMSDTLLKITLQENEIEFLSANSFVKVPKELLSLSKNKISRIEMDAFDLPALKNLDLNDNWLSKPNADSFKGLPSLKRLSLAWNGIEKINSNFWKHLDNVERLDISGNKIEKLENGDLSGMSKTVDGLVYVINTPIETIQGGVFSTPPTKTLENGDLSGVSNRGEDVIVSKMPKEVI